MILHNFFSERHKLDILCNRYTKRVHLIGVKTTNLGCVPKFYLAKYDYLKPLVLPITQIYLVIYSGISLQLRLVQILFLDQKFLQIDYLRFYFWFRENS